jgi:hypothetical protein
LTYNIYVPYPVLWPNDGPFYGPLDRRRWPQTEPATALEEDNSRFELISRNDQSPVLEMQWVRLMDAGERLCLRAAWNLRQEK